MDIPERRWVHDNTELTTDQAARRDDHGERYALRILSHFTGDKDPDDVIGFDHDDVRIRALYKEVYGHQQQTKRR